MDNHSIVFEYIKKNPGLTLAQISHRLNVSESTIRYHLYKLIKNHHIISEEFFKTRYFVHGLDLKNKLDSSIKNNNSLRMIYDILNKEMTLEEISTLCNVSKGFVSTRLKFLVSSNVVLKIKKDKKIFFKRK